MSLVKQIQLLCKENGITVPKLEKTFGFGNGAIYGWNKHSPSIDKLQRIADYFHVSLDYLVGREIYQIADHQCDLSLIVELVRELPVQDIKEIAEFIGFKIYRAKHATLEAHQ